MSRSRIDYDKGRRNRLGQAAVQAFAEDRAQSDGPSELLAQAVKGERLKSDLVRFVRAKKLRPEIFQRVFNLIRHSKIWVFAEKTREDGNIWYECKMRIRNGHEAYIESEQPQFLLNQLAERHELIGRYWTLYFWFPISNSPLNE
ncbi:MAG: hypothetical protein ABSH11_09335 [Verrucomicrobiota bacterium]|jgi:hypothetical protein